ncbi:MAG: helix-turn-helix domain-containing protein [Pyrinomonadaceae bacterium]
MDQRVQAITALMERHLHRDLSLEEMARSVNLSSSRLRHLFKAEIGRSPAEYLKLLRMQRARELIETTFLTMKQIMTEIGVKDKGHFTEDFKKLYDLTPAQYAARHRSASLLVKKAAAK